MLSVAVELSALPDASVVLNDAHRATREPDSLKTRHFSTQSQTQQMSRQFTLAATPSAPALIQAQGIFKNRLFDRGIDIGQF